MKLTNLMREAFVRNVMNDVPTVDYDEQYRKLALEAAVDRMPPEVLAAYKKFPLWISVRYGSLTKGGGWIEVPAPEDLDMSEFVSSVYAKKLKFITDLSSKQSTTQTDLRKRLEAVAKASTTTQALLKHLPEFEQYIPKDAQASTNLPAVQNVVADFVKAGWPKGVSK